MTSLIDRGSKLFFGYWPWELEILIVIGDTQNPGNIAGGTTNYLNSGQNCVNERPN